MSANNKVAATFHSGAETPKHEPLIYSTGRHGCWGECACGWRSKTWTAVMGVHLEFGKHLVEVSS